MPRARSAPASPAKQPEAARGVPRSPLLAEFVVALAPALDAVDRNEDGHALRSALVGLRLAADLDIDPYARGDLFHALLLKDLGAATARAKTYHRFGRVNERFDHRLRHADLADAREVVALLWPVLASGAPPLRRLRNAFDLALGTGKGPGAIERERALRASRIVLEMGFSHGTAAAIRSQNERWDGRGRPEGLKGGAIPQASRIVALASEVAAASFTETGDATLARLRAQADKRFDPRLVDRLTRLLVETDLWADLASDDLEELVLELEPRERRTVASVARVDRLLEGFARFIDSKSPWTARHSERVRDLAVGAGAHLRRRHRLTRSGTRRLARAALLHDLGRITAPNALLDRAGRLSDRERDELRCDDALACRVVDRVLDLADDALPNETLTLEPGPHEAADMEPAARAALDKALVQVAERYEALTAPRPQRPGMKSHDALALLRTEVEGLPARAAALTALELFLATPAAAPLLAPRLFDPNAIVIVD